MREPKVAAKSSFPTHIGLWLFSALIMVLFVVAKVAADRVFEKPHTPAPPVTIRVDDPSVMEGDAKAFFAFVERAVDRRRVVAIYFQGEGTNSRLIFPVVSHGSSGVADLLPIELSPGDDTEQGGRFDNSELAARMAVYFEAARLAGAEPVCDLRVASDVSLARVFRVLQFARRKGGEHFEIEGMSALLTE